MTTKIKMWGNSLAVRIPKDVSIQLDLKEGTDVKVEIKNNRIAIQPIRKKRPTLKELVDSITPENRHSLLLDDDTRKGAEVW
jgi:antitoxin MazE